MIRILIKIKETLTSLELKQQLIKYFYILKLKIIKSLNC
jgi:hypothetical protein